MAESSTAETVGKFGVGLGVGVALYFLIRNLGFGGGFGFGGGRGEARDEGAPAPSSTPPTMPRDEQRLEFVMVSPTTIDDKVSAFSGPGNKIFSLEEMLARIKAGGRTDMILKIRGDVISGPADAAEAVIKTAGIDIWTQAPPPLFPEKQPTRVSGNVRGQYGARSAVGRGICRGYGR